MLSSVAWKSLSTQERAVYIEIAALYNGSNNGKLALSVRDAADRANIAKDTAGKALKTLIERGFIECVTPGGFSRKTRHATEWRLTKCRCDRTGDLPSKAFMKWKPADADDGPKRSQRGPKRGTLNSLDIDGAL